MSGQCYQYDLSNSVDQRRYELDPGAQLRDEIHPGICIDRNLGQYGVGVQF